MKCRDVKQFNHHWKLLELHHFNTVQTIIFLPERLFFLILFRVTKPRHCLLSNAQLMRCSKTFSEQSCTKSCQLPHGNKECHPPGMLGIKNICTHCKIAYLPISEESRHSSCESRASKSQLTHFSSATEQGLWTCIHPRIKSEVN